MSSRASRTRPAARLVPVGPSQAGTASWYGGAWDGRWTASGERFRALGLSAASRTLPFGTRLRVCAAGPGQGRSQAARCVVVRVNDRGPRSPERMLDLSEGAAAALGARAAGLVRVTATPVELRPARAPRATHRPSPGHRAVRHHHEEGTRRAVRRRADLQRALGVRVPEAPSPARALVSLGALVGAAARFDETPLTS